jgi:hypothetical protein
MEFVPRGTFAHTESQRDDLWQINHFINEPLETIETQYDYDQLAENLDRLYRYSSQLKCRGEEIKILKQKMSEIAEVVDAFKFRYENNLNYIQRVGNQFVQGVTLGFINLYSLQPLDFKIRHIANMILTVESSLKEIDERRSSEDTSESRINELSSQWLDNVDEEFERLKKKGILTPEVLEEVGSEGMFRKIAKTPIQKPATLVLLGHALEIRHHLRHTHRTFTHGQAIGWTVLNMFNKELIRFQEPEKDINSFEFLRHPKLAGSEVSVSQAMARNLLPSDYFFTRSVLCVDGYLKNTSNTESALFFSDYNGNIQDILRQSINEVVNLYVQNDSVRKNTLESLMRLVDRVEESCHDTGNLCTISLPKHKVDDYVWRAHPYGTPCYCHPFSDSAKILKTLQKGDLSFWNNRCFWRGFVGDGVPQYRMLTHHLKPELGVISFGLDTLGNEEKKEIKHEIRSLVEDLFLASQLETHMTHEEEYLS